MVIGNAGNHHPDKVIIVWARVVAVDGSVEVVYYPADMITVQVPLVAVDDSAVAVHSAAG